MRHIDFTNYIIVPSDDAEDAYSVTRVDPAEHRCECCSTPAEYLLRSSWDTNAQCLVAQCQSCMIENNAGLDLSDAYVLVEIVV